MHEELFGAAERDERPFHPLISHTAVPPLELSEVMAPNPDVADWMIAASR